MEKWKEQQLQQHKVISAFLQCRFFGTLCSSFVFSIPWLTLLVIIVIAIKIYRTVK